MLVHIMKAKSKNLISVSLSPRKNEEIVDVHV
jgi:hypothetical protein